MCSEILFYFKIKSLQMYHNACEMKAENWAGGGVLNILYEIIPDFKHILYTV